MTAELDPRAAGWEAQLDRLDDARTEESEAPVPDRGEFDPRADAFGFHLTDTEDDDGALDALEDEVEDHEAQVPTVEVLDRLLVAFNHRDLVDLVDVVASDGEAPGLLGYTAANVPDAVADLWRRRPTVQLTRGRLPEEGPVAVLWEHDGAAWWQLAVVCVADVADDRAGVLEFVDDPDLLDRVRTSEPDDDLLEGERWEEWDEGTEP